MVVFVTMQLLMKTNIFLVSVLTVWIYILVNFTYKKNSGNFCHLCNAVNICSKIFLHSKVLHFWLNRFSYGIWNDRRGFRPTLESEVLVGLSIPLIILLFFDNSIVQLIGGIWTLVLLFIHLFLPDTIFLSIFPYLYVLFTL